MIVTAEQPAYPARERDGGHNSAGAVHPRTDCEIDSVRAILHRNKPVAVEEIVALVPL